MATFTNQAKNSATWANISKNVASWANQIKTLSYSFLLLENGGFLLQENGDKLILEQSSASEPTFTNMVKN